jgi:hypothetical protein
VTVHNTLNCSPTPPTSCTPPLIMGSNNVCICPFGGNVTGGQCAGTDLPPGGCPAGTSRRGSECVKVPVCRAPMVPNAAGNCACPQGKTQRGRECVTQQTACPDGTVRKGSRCVEAVVCRPPAKLQRGVCQCPTDMVASGNGCVPRERRIPDGIRNIPGGFGPGGGGREGPRGGGREAPGGGGAGGSPKGVR